MKNFDGWNEVKKETDIQLTNKYFKVRDIWWCRLGCNLGHEQDGKGNYFERPVLIIKKFNNRIFFGLPLSTKNKNNPFYIKVIDNKNVVRSSIISQLRLLDVSRLSEKVGYIDNVSHSKIKKSIRYLFR